MWHDRDPHREQQHVPDTFWLVVGGAVVRRLRAGVADRPGRRHPLRRPRASAGPAGRHARRAAAAPRHLGRPRPGLATLLPAAVAGPGGHVRRRGPHLLDSSLLSMGCWSGCSPRGPAAGASNAGPSGRAGGSCAASWSWGRGGGGSSSAAATASETASSAGCTWPSSNATRSWPSARQDRSRPTASSSRPSSSGRATWSPPPSNPTSSGPPAPTGPTSGPSGSTTPSA